MKYSVIIPVYNAARTLRRCLDSLVDQSFDDYELLLINDGSTDGSDAICHWLTLLCTGFSVCVGAVVKHDTPFLCTGVR